MPKLKRKPYFLLTFLAVVCVVITVFLIGRKVLSNQETITGTVTSIFTDCVGGEEMDKYGIIAPIKKVYCDGGDTITIDYNYEFVTAPGLLIYGEPYSVDVSSIKVGDRVKVHYQNDSDGFKFLGCKSCGVQKIK